METPTVALPYAEEQLQAAERLAEAWRHIVAGLRALNGSAPLFVPTEGMPDAATAISAVQRPKGMQAVREIVAERPGRWTLRELHDEFDKRGWRHTPDRRRFHATVDAAVHRLWKMGVAEQIEPGVYNFPAGDQGVLAA